MIIAIMIKVKIVLANDIKNIFRFNNKPIAAIAKMI